MWALILWLALPGATFPTASVARVSWVHDAQQSWGTAFALGPDRAGNGTVLATAGHLLRGYRCQYSAPVLVEVDGRVFEATVVCVDCPSPEGDKLCYRPDQYDAALLWIPHRIETVLPLATGPPSGGPGVVAAGYPTRRWAVRYGRWLRVEGNHAHWTAPLEPGGSGGPVLDAAGRVVALLDGATGPGEAIGLHARALRAYCVDRLGYFPGR